MSWHTEDFESHPYQDPAETTLMQFDDLSEEQRARLWDTFHASADPAELAQKLQAHDVPNAVKHALWTAKSLTAPVRAPLDRAADALREFAKLDQ
jgi:hypothetical protein